MSPKLTVLTTWMSHCQGRAGFTKCSHGLDQFATQLRANQAFRFECGGDQTSTSLLCKSSMIHMWRRLCISSAAKPQAAQFEKATYAPQVIHDDILGFLFVTITEQRQLSIFRVLRVSYCGTDHILGFLSLSSHYYRTTLFIFRVLRVIINKQSVHIISGIESSRPRTTSLQTPICTASFQIHHTHMFKSLITFPGCQCCP